MNHDIKKGRLIDQGKTKIIWEDPDDKNRVLIESKDDITAGDGVRRHVLSGKGALATTTTGNCFKLLELYGVPTHYLGQVTPTIFRARRMQMIPIEIVARRIATGSYLKRNPEVAEGTRFEPLVLELFFKDDARHDPLMVLSDDGFFWELYDAKKPLTEGPIDLMAADDQKFRGRVVDKAVRDRMFKHVKSAFRIFEGAWVEHPDEVTLVDLKIEDGFAAATGELRIGDVIDNDSWRIWPKGKKALDVSKQVYRDLPEVTDEMLKPIRDKYAWVAQATEQFVA